MGDCDVQVYGLRRGAQDKQHVFKFVSVFKWELRKGWDALLSAYLTEFTWGDHVSSRPAVCDMCDALDTVSCAVTGSQLTGAQQVLLGHTCMNIALWLIAHRVLLYMCCNVYTTAGRSVHCHSAI
jgi:hypothetical protein